MHAMQPLKKRYYEEYMYSRGRLLVIVYGSTLFCLSEEMVNLDEFTYFKSGNDVASLIK